MSIQIILPYLMALQCVIASCIYYWGCDIKNGTYWLAVAVINIVVAL